MKLYIVLLEHMSKTESQEDVAIRNKDFFFFAFSAVCRSVVRMNENIKTSVHTDLN